MIARIREYLRSNPKTEAEKEEELTPEGLIIWLLGRFVTHQAPFDRHAFYLHVLSVPNECEDAFEFANCSNGIWCLVKWIEMNYGSEQSWRFINAALLTIRSKPGEGAYFLETGLGSLLSARPISEVDDFPVGSVLIARYGDLELGKAHSFLTNVAPNLGFTRESIENLGAYFSTMTPYCFGCFDAIQQHIPKFLDLTPVNCEPLGSISFYKPVPPGSKA